MKISKYKKALEERRKRRADSPVSGARDAMDQEAMNKWGQFIQRCNKFNSVPESLAIPAHSREMRSFVSVITTAASSGDWTRSGSD